MNRLVSGLRSSRRVKAFMCFAALAFLCVFYGLAVYNTPKTDAAVQATDFVAGRIIDDEIFYDANTMSVEEIQAFLDAKLPTCDMWGTGSSAGRVVSETGYVMPEGSTNADYARLRAAAGNTRYHEPPYVCVNKYYENPETHETLYETNGIVKDGMISAAQIIYNEAHKYNINPQVLLVLLKKESYVWGDTWPLKWEYNSAMGYGCPDTAPCDTAYYGFYNQVHMAAYQFDRYKQNNYEYNYHPGMVNNIYYSPTYSCGTKQVYIENMATASLYIYTPYTPNDAALRNYPGTSYCGSYGNRNFFMYFNEWFGSTHAASWMNLVMPRVLTASKDTLKIEIPDGGISDEWIYEGESLMFSSKINVLVNGVVYSCLRTMSDEANGINKCILFERLEEYVPVITALDENYFLTSEYTCLVHLRNMTVDCNNNLNSNELFYSLSKTEVEGVTYLLDDENGLTGYRMDRFQDERYKSLIVYDKVQSIFSMDGARKHLANFEKSSKQKRGITKIFGEVTIEDSLYYLLNEKGEIEIINSEDTEDTLFWPFIEPRYMTINRDAQIINLINEEQCYANGIEFFNRKTYFNDELYYMYGEGECGVRADNVKEIESLVTNFVIPRNMVVTQNAKPIDLVHGDICMEISDDKVIFFSKKILVGDKAYYLVDGEASCGVLSDDAVEIDSYFNSFVFPRKMQVYGTFVDLFTGEKCRDSYGNSFFFNTKTRRDGVDYYRTKDDADAMSTCVVSSSYVNDL